MESTQKEQSSLFIRHLYLVLAVGVPGIGKSYLIGNFKKFIQTLPDHSINVCTSDEVRSKTLAQYYLDNNIKLEDLSQEEIYKIEDINVPNTRAALMVDIQQKLEEANQSRAVHNVFILDKNHSSKTLISFVEEVAFTLFGEVSIHHVVLVPDTFGCDADKLCYPFNFDTLLVGLIRSLLRKSHLTMKHGTVHSLLSFIGCLQGQIKEPFSDRFPEDRYTQVPVHYYDAQKLKEGLQDPKMKAMYDELHELIWDMTTKKKTVTEGAPRTVELVKGLESLNSFPPSTEYTLKEIYSKVLESK
jgi:hypothetical protein